MHVLAHMTGYPPLVCTHTAESLYYMYCCCSACSVCWLLKSSYNFIRACVYATPTLLYTVQRSNMNGYVPGTIYRLLIVQRTQYTIHMGIYIRYTTGCLLSPHAGVLLPFKCEFLRTKRSSCVSTSCGPFLLGQRRTSHDLA